MSSPFKIRFILRDLSVTRLLSAWRRNFFVNNLKKCKSENGVKEALHRFRQTFRPRRTFLLSVTAAYKNGEDDDDEGLEPCINSITDEELQELVDEIGGVEELAEKTLYCEACDKRIVIDKKHPGVLYCVCPHHHTKMSALDGWVPYMEADDVIVWRKEYKPGQGLFAYKVYGRYPDIRAQDFAAVNVDGAYRREWDSAVAALSIVERSANGVSDQVVLHWEVLWPRLFANRDYVYIRRHKEFDVKAKCFSHKDGLFKGQLERCPEQTPKSTKTPEEHPNVHSRAKRKSQEEEHRQVANTQKSEKESSSGDNKVYVIVSRSCAHPQVPETKSAIRVTEYWSDMVIQTLHGPDKMGMEFVLTYYDEPAVGGLPSGVNSWATARAVPAFLASMRRAASEYRAWRRKGHKDAPDFTPFGPENVSFHGPNVPHEQVREEDMESSKQGPDIEADPQSEQKNTVTETKDKSTQVDIPPEDPEEVLIRLVDHKTASDKAVQTSMEPPPQQEENDKLEEDTPPEEEIRWWRYLYPFYYFV